MNARKLHVVAEVCRVLLALTFIFSGFVKTIDPWGTAIKITEYLNGFGFHTLNEYRFGFAIWLCGAELMMGCMLLARVRTPLISIFSLFTMTVFTILTFIIAKWGTVDDCGCFGDAVKLTNWETFFKNLVLWPMAFLVWWDARKGRIWPITRREGITTVVIMCFAFGLGAYCYRHLPLIDFLPYKVGVDLRAARNAEVSGEVHTTLIYRDRTDGSIHEFSVDDTTWYDTERWEFVDRRDDLSFSADVSLREFAVFDPEGDYTDEILGNPGRVYLISAVKLDAVKPWCAKHLAALVERATSEGAAVVCLTATPIEAGERISFGESPSIPLYNVDATTLITMIRAKVGVVQLDDGVITGKRNCRDVE